MTCVEKTQHLNIKELWDTYGSTLKGFCYDVKRKISVIREMRGRRLLTCLSNERFLTIFIIDVKTEIVVVDETLEYYSVSKVRRRWRLAIFLHFHLEDLLPK